MTAPDLNDLSKGPPLPPSRPQDWPEDYDQENGRYVGQCLYCEIDFFGHKLRNVCRLCAPEREKVAGSSRAESRAQDAQAEGPGSPSSRVRDLYSEAERKFAETVNEIYARAEVDERRRRLDEFAKAALTGLMATIDQGAPMQKSVLAYWAVDYAEATIAEIDRRAALAKLEALE